MQRPKKKLKDSDIVNIYENFVKANFTDSNRLKHSRLPFKKNNKRWKWEGKDFPRVISLLEFGEYIDKNKLSFDKALCINGADDPEYEYIVCKERRIVHYAHDPINHDLHSLSLKENDFDFVMLNQTLEHLYDPILCLQNVYDHMREGGMLYMNVPANNIPHSTPFHYYTGFTATGLGAVVESAGFKIKEIGQWGNYEYLQKLFSLGEWPDYRSLANPGVNEFQNPVIVWVFATK